jgi:DNA adenine methylase
MTPPRPALRYHGGKFRLAPWVISHFCAHTCYVEPYGGAASVLLRKRRSAVEVYNDLDGRLVGLFQVLRGPRAEELIRALEFTPYARSEYDLSWEPADDPVEAARRLIIRSFMGISPVALGRPKYKSFRVCPSNNHTAEWVNYADALAVIVERIKGVIVENLPALELMQRYDDDALFYCDPPYLSSTRQYDLNRGYVCDMTDDDHAEMLDLLRGLKASVVLSGYPNGIYEASLAGWRCIRKTHFAEHGSKRTEALWLNPQAASGVRQGELF